MDHDELLAYYTAPGVFTGVGGFEGQVGAVPDGAAAVAATVQGLLIHEALGPLYRVELSPERRATERELHSADAMLQCATRADARAITVERAPEHRAAGVCRHFATLFVAIMRHKGVPARARCGFANYFERGKHLDHWAGEYWNAEQHRWVLVDAQVDSLQRKIFQPDFDTIDVPRDRFLVAGDAWQLCRTGAADAQTFGVAGTDNWGIVEVLGDLLLDLAALQNTELLPWGWYGLATEDGACENEVKLIDCLALLSMAADAPALTELRSIVAMDPRLAPPLERVTETRRAETAADFSTAS